MEQLIKLLPIDTVEIISLVNKYLNNRINTCLFMHPCVSNENWPSFTNPMACRDDGEDNHFLYMVDSGRNNLVRRMINTHDTYDWHSGLCHACSHGNIKIVQMIIDEYIYEWNTPFISACKGGYIDIVKLIIEKGKNNWEYWWEYSFDGSCAGVSNKKYSNINWNTGLGYACEGKIWILSD